MNPQYVELTPETAAAEIKKYEDVIAMEERLNRLKKNRDFKALIEDLYLNTHAAGVVATLAHPGMQDEENQKYLMLELQGISHFREFLRGVYQNADQARKNIEQLNEAREELEAEEGFDA